MENEQDREIHNDDDNPEVDDGGVSYVKSLTALFASASICHIQRA